MIYYKLLEKNEKKKLKLKKLDENLKIFKMIIYGILI